MRSSEARIIVGVARMLLLMATSAGLSRERVLAAAGVTEADLLDADGRLALSKHRRIGETIVALLPATNLAAMVSEHFNVSVFGIVGKVAENSAEKWRSGHP